MVLRLFTCTQRRSHDFYDNPRKVDLLCDIADGTADNLSEYDLETIAEMVREGYVISESGGFRVAMPIYSKAQYGELMGKSRAVYEK